MKINHWKQTEEAKKKISLAMKGKNNPFYGKKHTAESRLKISLNTKGRIPWNKGKKGLQHHSAETRLKISEKISEMFKGKGNPFWKKQHSKKTISKIRIAAIRNSKNPEWLEKVRVGTIKGLDKPEIRKRIRETSKARWEDREYRNRVTKAIGKGAHLRPNIPETQINQIIKLNNLPINYTGDNKIRIEGFNPDFLSKKLKCIIEVFGEYHHNFPNSKKQHKRRLKAYSSLDYKTLVIWSKELKNPQQVTEKIINFITN